MNKLQETIKALIKKLCSNKGWYEILTLASDSEMPWRLVLSQVNGRYHIVGVLVLSSMTFFKLKKYELKEVPENHVLESVKDTPFLLLDLSRDLNPRSVIMDSFKVDPSIFDSKHIVQDAARLNRVYESLYDIRDRIKLLNNFGRVVLTRNHPSAVIRKSDLWEALNLGKSFRVRFREIFKVPDMNCNALFVTNLLSEVFMYENPYVWEKRPLVVFRKIVLPQFMEKTNPEVFFWKANGELNGELYEFQGQYECFKTNPFGDTFWRLSSDSVSIGLGCEGRLRLIPMAKCNMEKANVIFNELCEDSFWRYTLMMVTDAMVPWRLVLRSDGMKMEAVGIELMDTLTFVEMETGVAVDGLYLSDIPDAIKIGEYYAYDIQSLLNDEL